MSEFKRRRSLLLGCLGTVTALVAIALILWPHHQEISQGLDQVSPSDFLVVCLLLLPSLLLRAEAWQIILHNARGALPRRSLYAAFACNLAVNNINAVAGLATQIAVLRRLEPERAPSATQLAAAALPMFWVEGSLAVLILFISASTLDLSPLLLVGLGLGAFLGLWGMRFLEKRTQQRAALQGLAIVSRPWELFKVGILMAFSFLFQLLRLAFALHAVGLSPDPFLVTAAFVGGGALGLLPIGAASAPAALIAVYSTHDLALAAVAGIVTAASVLLVSVLLALWFLPLLLKGGTFRKMNF